MLFIDESSQSLRVVRATDRLIDRPCLATEHETVTKPSMWMCLCVGMKHMVHLRCAGELDQNCSTSHYISVSAGKPPSGPNAGGVQGLGPPNQPESTKAKQFSPCLTFKSFVIAYFSHGSGGCTAGKRMNNRWRYQLWCQILTKLHP